MTLKVLSVVGNIAICEGEKKVTFPVNVAKPKAGDSIEASEQGDKLRPVEKPAKAEPAKK